MRVLTRLSVVADVMCNLFNLLRPGRLKQPRILTFKADDENDHDSLNQSGAEGAEGQGSSCHIPGLMSGNGTDGIGSSGAGVTAEPAAGFGVAGSAVEQQLLLQQQSTNSSTPVVRPTTPIGERPSKLSHS